MHTSLEFLNAAEHLVSLTVTEVKHGKRTRLLTLSPILMLVMGWSEWLVNVTSMLTILGEYK